MREIQIRLEESGQRLDKFLRRYLPAAGSGFLYKMLRKKNILLDGKKASGKELLHEGSCIQIYFSEETLRAFQARQESDSETMKEAITEKDIVYADDSLLLVNKPAGILTQKADRNDISLTEMVLNWLRANGYRDASDSFFYEPGPVNRLDRNTSGLVVVPLTLAAARQAAAMFRERTIHKQYLALTAGRYCGQKRRQAWCLRDTHSRTTEILFREKEGADRIETIFEPVAFSADRTLLEVTLITGKSHQIRAHLQACGFPVIGDPKYGRFLNRTTDGTKSCPDAKPVSGLRRQFLHAWKLQFPECDGALRAVSNRVFTAPLPEDLSKELKAAGIPIPDNAPDML